MKKLAALLVCILTAAGAFLPLSGESGPDIDRSLRPYQDVIDKVNRELGSTIYIPEENREEVYGNIKDLSLSEFEAIMRKEYPDTLPPADPKDHGVIRAPIPRDRRGRSSAKPGEFHTREDAEGMVQPLPNADGQASVMPLQN